MNTTPSEMHTPLRLIRYDTDEYPKFCPGDARIVGPDNICYGILFGALEQVREPQDAFIAAVNERAKLLERVRVLEEALQARVMRPIEELPDWDHRPIRQFIRVEGAKEHSGESWHRVWFDVAYIERDAPFGYRQSDMERARKDGGMDYIERVTHWAPAVFGVSNDTFAALKAE